MPRVKPRNWPVHGCLQIGFNDEDELDRIRVRLGDLVLRNVANRRRVWDVELGEWVHLSFGGNLTNFCTRKRHPNPKKVYTHPTGTAQCSSTYWFATSRATPTRPV